MSAPEALNPYIIYDGSTIQPLLDGTLNGVQPFTCRLSVNRETRQQHDTPDAISFGQYQELVVDVVESLVLRGLRTAVYCGIGDQARQYTSAIGRRTINVAGSSRPIKTGILGNYVQSVKETSGVIRAFNQGRLDAVVSSRLFETTTNIRPDALVIALSVLSKRVLEDVLGNLSHADPSHPALTVVEMIELAAGRSGRTTYTVWDTLGENVIDQGTQIGGYLDSQEDPDRIFTLKHLPEHIRPKFIALQGSPVLAAVMNNATEHDLEPLTLDLKPLEEIAALYAPHIPVKLVRHRLEEAGLEVRFVHKEIDGEIVRVPMCSLTKATKHFAKHPVPPFAGPEMQTARSIAQRLGASQPMVEAVIAELGDKIAAQPLLHPERRREWPYYDPTAQALIEAGVAKHKKALAEFHATAERRRAEKIVYQPAAQGDISLAKLAAQAGVGYTYARQQLEDVMDLPFLQPQGGKPGLHVLEADIERALGLITPVAPPVHRVPSPAIYARLHHRTPRAIDGYLAGFPAFKRRQPGRGPLVIDRPWEAFRHAEEKLGAPDDAIPLVWEYLPTTDRDVSKEQESYARAVQVLYLDETRMGPAAIMTRDTAAQFLHVAHQVATGQPVNEPNTVTAVEVVDQPAEIPPEPEPSELPESQAMWLDEYASQFNHAQGTNAPINDFVQLAERIGVEILYDETYGPYLTTEGRQTMDAHLARLQPPEGWVRVKTVVDALPGVSFHTVNDYLTDIGSKDDMGEFLYKGVHTVRFVSPERAAKLRERFGGMSSAQTMPHNAPAPAPRQKKQTGKAGLPKQAAAEASPLASAPPPKLPAGARVLQSAKPLSFLDIINRTGCGPAAVRAAITAASQQLGPKKFKTITLRDHQEVLTEHYDPGVLTAIEDNLLGVHPGDLAHRLNIREQRINQFLDEMGYNLNDRGRIHGEALQAVIEFFHTD